MSLTPPCIITSGSTFEICGSTYEVIPGDVVRDPKFITAAQNAGVTLEEITEGVASAVSGRRAVAGRTW